jgi:hypothetical protein
VENLLNLSHVTILDVIGSTVTTTLNTTSDDFHMTLMMINETAFSQDINVGSGGTINGGSTHSIPSKTLAVFTRIDAGTWFTP